MFENELLDEKDNRKYFIYMTNRSPSSSFPMFEEQLKDIQNRLREIDMGYTNLWVMKRIGIIKEDKCTNFLENDSEDIDGEGNNRYFTFLFIKMDKNSPHIIYSSYEKTKGYSTFEEAAENATKLLAKKKSYYPERVYYVLCGKLINDYMWH